MASLTDLSGEQERAIVLYRNYVLRRGAVRWKGHLKDAWLKASYVWDHPEYDCHLQTIRNQLGPTWLTRVSENHFRGSIFDREQYDYVASTWGKNWAEALVEKTLDRQFQEGILTQTTVVYIEHADDGRVFARIVDWKRYRSANLAPSAFNRPVKTGDWYSARVNIWAKQESELRIFDPIASIAPPPDNYGINLVSRDSFAKQTGKIYGN